jgi:general secretion pathway protein C
MAITLRYLAASVPLLRLAANLTLAALLGYAAARLVLPAPPPAQAALPTATASSAAPPSQLDLAPLRQASLFGAADQATPAVAEAALVAPETPLNLQLLGTLATEQQNTARAIVANPDGEARTYTVGKTLPSGAAVQAIYADRIIILRGNRYETLKLAGKKALEQSGLLAAPAAAKTTAAPASDASARLAEYRRQILQKPALMADYLRVRPAEDSAGKFTGYLLQTGKNPQVLADFGLQEGDLLTSVNGVALDSPLQGLNALQQLASAEQIDLQVIRNGQPMSLSFRVGN